MPAKAKKKGAKSSGKAAKGSKKDAGKGGEQPPAPAAAAPASPDFDAGRLFQRYDPGGSGVLDFQAFRRMVAELGIKAPTVQPSDIRATPRTEFEAGRLFERFDTNRTGRLERDEFHELMRALGGSLGAMPPTASPPAAYPAAPRPPPPAPFPASATASALSGPAPYTAFDEGRLFQRFDPANTGGVDLENFRRLFASARSGQLPVPAPRTGPSLGPFSGADAALYGSGDALYGGLLPPAPPTGADLALPADLDAAFHARLRSLGSAQAELARKRERLVHHLARLAARREEVEAARRAIERETLADTEAVLHRLRTAEAHKLSTLQRDADEATRAVEAVDQFARTLQHFLPGASPADSAAAAGAEPPRSAAGGAATDPHVALQFMRSYPQLTAEADRLLAAPVPATVDVRADDFEREVATRAATLRRHQSVLELLAAKDEVIRMLLREREEVTREVGALSEGSATEVEEWQALAERLAAELRRLQAVGGAAGVPTDDEDDEDDDAEADHDDAGDGGEGADYRPRSGGGGGRLAHLEAQLRALQARRGAAVASATAGGVARVDEVRPAAEPSG